MLDQVTQFIEQNFKTLMLCGLGGLALALFIVVGFKAINGKWKLPFF
jgi:hypothetical protein